MREKCEKASFGFMGLCICPKHLVSRKHTVERSATPWYWLLFPQCSYWCTLLVMIILLLFLLLSTRYCWCSCHRRFWPCELLEINSLKTHFWHYLLVFNLTIVVSYSGYTCITGGVLFCFVLFWTHHFHQVFIVFNNILWWNDILNISGIKLMSPLSCLSQFHSTVKKKKTLKFSCCSYRSKIKIKT